MAGEGRERKEILPDSRLRLDTNDNYDDTNLPKVYLVSALFLTHLTVPSQLLETFCFNTVCYGFWGKKSWLVFAHTESSLL